MTRPRTLLLAALPITLVLAAWCAGTQWVTPRELLAGVLGREGPALRTVLLDIRLPRIAVATLTGAALATSGAALQGLLRNPLADPSVLGVTSGAGLGAVLAIYTGLGARTPWAVPVGACLGGLCITYVLVRSSALSVLRGRTGLVLLGLAIGQLGAAAISLVIALSLANYDVASQIVRWLLGGLDGRTWTHVVWAAPPIALGYLLVWRERRGLDALLLDRIGAMAVGVDGARVERRIVLATALLAGASVAVGGNLGFVGLVVPHAARLAVGALHVRLLPACALVGAAFTLAADVLARTVVAPEELPLGALTAAVGAPLFVVLLLRHARALEPP